MHMTAECIVHRVTVGVTHKSCIFFFIILHIDRMSVFFDMSSTKYSIRHDIPIRINLNLFFSSVLISRYESVLKTKAK